MCPMWHVHSVLTAASTKDVLILAGNKEAQYRNTGIIVHVGITLNPILFFFPQWILALFCNVFAFLIQLLSKCYSLL